MSLAVVAASFGLAACDDGGESGDNSQLLKRISSTEARALCEFERQLHNASFSSAEAYCFESTWPDPETCEAEIAECLASGEYDSVLADETACQKVTAEDYVRSGGDCDATVAEYKACINAGQRSSIAHYEKATCDDPDSIAPPEKTDECKALFAKCTDLWR